KILSWSDRACTFERILLIRNSQDKLLHILCESKQLVIQIVVFYNYYNHYYRLYQIPDKYHLPYKFYFGQYNAIYDSFNLSKIIFEDTTVFIPHQQMDLVHFLTQINSSRLINCNRTSARLFRKQYPNSTRTTMEQIKTYQEIIIKFKVLLKHFHIPFFIYSGTLLGWYRQCSLIPYTTDVDFATFSQFASNETTERLGNKSLELAIPLIHIFGFPEHAFENRFLTKMSIDLFFLYDNIETNKLITYLHYDKSYYAFAYPLIDNLCATDYLGFKINVPCNAFDYIIADYGENWSKPIRDGVYAPMGSNFGSELSWPYAWHDGSFDDYLIQIRNGSGR
ncbi:unnamed protein product, partial [Didymodactylos carnosus]